MKIGILGSGTVGQQLGLGFIKTDNEVLIGTRNKDKLKDWAGLTDKKGCIGSFTEAAKFGDVIVIATKWIGTKNALDLTGAENFRNKVVIDVTNPLRFETENQPPVLDIAFPNSAGALIQTWLPESHVVKAFNIVAANTMCSPKREEGIPDLFIAGNEKSAKDLVKSFAVNWGWNVHDIGEIGESYLLEALAMVWIRVAFNTNQWTHAFKMLMK